VLFVQRVDTGAERKSRSFAAIGGDAADQGINVSGQCLGDTEMKIDGRGLGCACPFRII
jgi:hypothetical protein